MVWRKSHIGGLEGGGGNLESTERAIGTEHAPSFVYICMHDALVFSATVEK